MGRVFSSCRNVYTSNNEITLLLIGLDNAGKTSTAKHLSGESLDDVVPTVGFSVIHLKHKKFHVTIYDLGGGSKIRGIWKNYYASVYGIIFVVDATDASRTDECKTVITEVIQDPRISGKPLLVLVNKQDLEGALDESDICSMLNLESLVNEFKCPTRVELSSVAVRQGKKMDRGVELGFQWILRHISKNFKEINERVEKDIAVQKEKEEKERCERLERVRKIQEEREKQRNGSGCGSDEPDNQDVSKNGCLANPFRPLSEIQAEIEKREGETSTSLDESSPKVIHVSPVRENDNSVLPQTVQDTPVLHHKDVQSSSHNLSYCKNSLPTLERLPSLTLAPNNEYLMTSRKKKKAKKMFKNKVAPNDTMVLKESASSSDLTDSFSEKEHSFGKKESSPVKVLAKQKQCASNGQVNWAFAEELQNSVLSNEDKGASKSETEGLEK